MKDLFLWGAAVVSVSGILIVLFKITLPKGEKEKENEVSTNQRSKHEQLEFTDPVGSYDEQEEV